MREKVYAIDIETVSQGKSARDFTDKQSYALGNVKDPVKVEAKLQEKREEAGKKHGLSWWLGKVCSVALIDLHTSTSYVYYGVNERKILEDLASLIGSGPIKLIGKTSINFDFPFLVGRFMANDIRVPNCLKKRTSMMDVDNFFGFSAQSGQRTKLSNYAHGLGIDPKTLDGSKVQAVYDMVVMAMMEKDEEAVELHWRAIIDYNLQDSQIVKEMALSYYGPDIGDIYGH